jgi:hypothetical protein
VAADKIPQLDLALEGRVQDHHKCLLAELANHPRIGCFTPCRGKGTLLDGPAFELLTLQLPS